MDRQKRGRTRWFLGLEKQLIRATSEVGDDVVCSVGISKKSRRRIQRCKMDMMTLDSRRTSLCDNHIAGVAAIAVPPRVGVKDERKVKEERGRKGRGHGSPSRAPVTSRA